MSGAIGMTIALLLKGGTVGYLLAVMATSIRREVGGSKARPFKDFGLSITLAILFFASWIGQAIAQYQEFADQQAEHGGRSRWGTSWPRSAVPRSRTGSPSSCSCSPSWCWLPS